jgi:SpoVK/Ycf46/Vps4 family AAA+-type ATPase
VRGSLLFGPPGTGKTHVVRALARESGAHMLALTASRVLHSHVGASEKIVHAAFALARRLAPCVVFIDELDALFAERGAERGYRAMLTEFMQEMDGLLSKGENVVVIGATNRPFDLDDALLRRLPVRLLVDLPGEKEREGAFLTLCHGWANADVFAEILKILLRSESLGNDVDLAKIARDTNKFSGSDLKRTSMKTLWLLLLLMHRCRSRRNCRTGRRQGSSEYALANANSYAQDAIWHRRDRWGENFDIVCATRRQPSWSRSRAALASLHKRAAWRTAKHRREH